jgi:dTDP-4-amino-4,6-dideoxygalactose transaminase
MTNRQLDLIEMIGVQTRLNAEEEQTLLRVLRDARTLATGPEGEAFEREFAAYTGSANAVCLSSCSAALDLTATLAGLGEGDEVILPAHTFVASAVPFGRSGATLKWADIDPDTRVISAASIRSLVSPRTKAIVVVHLYGLPCDMDEIMAIAHEHGLTVIEDCAQAPGAHYKGRRVGSIGHFGCFSFHTHKNMSTLGEGGMLTTQDADQARAARRLRWMGNWPFEQHRERYWKPAMNDLVEPVPGRWPVNYCMGEPNAAVGRLLLKRLDRINDQRREQAQRFMRNLSDIDGLVFQAVPDDRDHAYHLMSARVDRVSRDDLIQTAFDKYRLKLLVQYWPLNRSELFQRFGYGDANVPNTDQFFDRMISFPWWSQMGDDLIDDMADRFRSAWEDVSRQ